MPPSLRAFVPDRGQRLAEWQLQPDDSGVTSGELARRFGVTTTTIANWRNAGMPGRKTSGGYLYDPEACKRWVDRNTGGKRHGGKRPGAGRRRSPVPPDRRLKNAVEVGQAKEAARERQAEFVHVDDLLQVTWDELKILVLGLEVDESGADKSKLERLKLVQDARARYREEREKLGELVNAADAAAEMAKSLAAVRERLDQLPMRLVRGVMLALGDAAGRADEPKVLEAMTKQVDTVIGEIRQQLGSEQGPRH